MSGAPFDSFAKARGVPRGAFQVDETVIDEIVADVLPANRRGVRRLKRQGAVRKYFAQASIDYIENTAGVLESRENAVELALEFQNADRVSVGYGDFLETLPAPLRIGSVTTPVGSSNLVVLRDG